MVPNIMQAGEAARVFASSVELHRQTGLPLEVADFVMAVLAEPAGRFPLRVGRAGREYPVGTAEWSDTFWTSDPASTGRCVEFLPGPGSDDCTFAFTLRAFVHETGDKVREVADRLRLAAAPCPFGWWNEYVVGTVDQVLAITDRRNFWRREWAAGPPVPEPPPMTDRQAFASLIRDQAERYFPGRLPAGFATLPDDEMFDVVRRLQKEDEAA